MTEGRHLESIYVISTKFTYVDKTRRNMTVDLWHINLRYINYHKLKAMMKKSMLKDLPQLEVRAKIVYAGCQYGKVYQLS